MKNVVFLSPNFPTNYWQFCRELKNNGMNVLGIGDQPYEELMEELKGSLTEYFRVDSLEDYDQVYRAVGYFIFKYGRIDWLESNNEYWLERDARLRTLGSGDEAVPAPLPAFSPGAGWMRSPLPAAGRWGAGSPGSFPPAPVPWGSGHTRSSDAGRFSLLW